LGINKNYQVFPKEFQEKINDYFENGGNLFISGAYIGADLVGHKNKTPGDVSFAENNLKINWQTDHAVVNGDVFSVDSLFLNPFKKIQFNTTQRSDIYTVESPDAIDPANGAKTILRYSENRFSAATAYFGDYSVILFGFPFETIIGEENRTEVMRAIISNFQFYKTD